MADAGSPRIPPGTLFRNPANFLALGGGSGLAPKAPGTFGTLAAVPLAFLMPAGVAAQIVVIVVLFVIGVWCCDRCARDLGVHDHGGIVWDEIVGYLLTMLALPRSLGWIVLGFVLFRVFDIAKPWPIGAIDRRVGGGFGIMIDDIVAALFAAVILQLLWRAEWLAEVPGFG